MMKVCSCLHSPLAICWLIARSQDGTKNISSLGDKIQQDLEGLRRYKLLILFPLMASIGEMHSSQPQGKDMIRLVLSQYHLHTFPSPLITRLFVVAAHMATREHVLNAKNTQKVQIFLSVSSISVANQSLIIFSTNYITYNKHIHTHTRVGDTV